MRPNRTSKFTFGVIQAKQYPVDLYYLMDLSNSMSDDKDTIGKKHALKKYDQFALNTSCFGGSTGSNITPVVQFDGIFVTKIMNKLFYYYC